jgi:hypothetical protein
LQNELLSFGLKNENTPYSQLVDKESRTGPDFRVPKWYLWGRFMEFFRNEGTDPLGKIAGHFLSPSNKEHVKMFRRAGSDEYLEELYKRFRGVYTNLRNVKCRNNPHLDKKNPFINLVTSGIRGDHQIEAIQTSR